ncbi:MAG: hypothetical protein V1743_02305, partial [Nanoarchaeota archaeon]
QQTIGLLIGGYSLDEIIEWKMNSPRKFQHIVEIPANPRFADYRPEPEAQSTRPQSLTGSGRFSIDILEKFLAVSAN